MNSIIATPSIERRGDIIDGRFLVKARLWYPTRWCSLVKEDPPERGDVRPP